MINKILSALEKAGVSVFSIVDTVNESAELYFIRKQEDMRRMKNIREITVTVFRDFEANEKKMRGSSDVQIAPGMTDEEIFNKISVAYDAAGYVMNPFFELADGVKELLAYVEEQLPEVGFEVTTDQIYFSKRSPQTEKHRIDEFLPDITCDYKTFDEPIIKILFGVDAKLVDKLIKTINSHPNAGLFDYIRSDHEYFEILPKGASKGALLKKIAELHGIDMSKTIVAGDNDNDVSMLEAAGVGVAVSNASPAAKKAADYHTVSNEEHAIARIVKDLEAGKLFG